MYIDRFFKILKTYYNDQKQKINTDKTLLLVLAKPKHQDFKDEIRRKEETETVHQKQQIRVLGWVVNEQVRMDTHINTLTGSIHATISNLKPIEKYMDIRTKKMLASSHMISKLIYGLPLYLGETQTTQHRIHQTYMMILRWTRSSYCSCKSISSIWSSSKWETPAQLL